MVTYFKRYDEDWVYKDVDHKKSYIFDNGEWRELRRWKDYLIGFGDSFLYDEITEDEAKKLPGVDEL